MEMEKGRTGISMSEDIRDPKPSGRKWVWPLVAAVAFVVGIGLGGAGAAETETVEVEVEPANISETRDALDEREEELLKREAELDAREAALATREEVPEESDEELERMLFEAYAPDAVEMLLADPGTCEMVEIVGAEFFTDGFREGFESDGSLEWYPEYDEILNGLIREECGL